MRVPRFLPVLPAFLILGCSGVSAKGRILDAGGMPITDARASVHAEGSSPALETAPSDDRGCFNVYIISPPRQQRFLLEVRAPGRKAVTLEFGRNERDPLLVTLIDQSGVQPSGIRAVTPDERSSVYDIYCVPMVVPGATSLGLR